MNEEGLTLEVKKKNSVLKRLLAGVLAVCVIGTGIPGTPVNLGLLRTAASAAGDLLPGTYRIRITGGNTDGVYSTTENSTRIKDGLPIPTSDILKALGISYQNYTPDFIEINGNDSFPILYLPLSTEENPNPDEINFPLSIRYERLTDLSRAKINLNTSDYSVSSVTLNGSPISPSNYTISYEKKIDGVWTDVESVSGKGDFCVWAKANDAGLYCGETFLYFDIYDPAVTTAPAASTTAIEGDTDAELITPGTVDHGFFKYAVTAPVVTAAPTTGWSGNIPTVGDRDSGTDKVWYQVYNDFGNLYSESP